MKNVHPAKGSTTELRVRHRVRAFLAVIALSIWTVGSVFFLGGALANVIFTVGLIQLGVDEATLPQSLTMTVLSTLVYVIGLLILLVEPYGLRRYGKTKLLALLGMSRRLQMKDVYAALLGWAGYFMATMIVSIVVVNLISGYDNNQVQEIGFETGGGTMLDKMAAFLTIVIAAPIVEEIVFRGYLQGSLRRLIPWWLAAVISSALFGAVHGQWNVAIDVTVMALVACYLRERTGTIWAGIGLHMIKNGFAYVFLFLTPPWVMKLLGM